ncbi:MAG: hypothetical protein JWO99_326 [Candidatus Saccharibacteria bacterium]|nr:hypothetical protein [Candidatus Saccharibacteria bacterium]
MHAVWKRDAIQSIVIILVTIIGFSLSHLGLGVSDEMMSMDIHTNPVACQNICTYATTATENQRLFQNEGIEKEPQTFYLGLAGVSLALIGALLTSRRLYLLSSWRPPDILLLTGRYSDGL